MRTFYTALLRHRALALAALLAVTLGFGRLLVDPGQLFVDFSLEALLVPDARARADLASLHEDFGDDLGIVGVLLTLPEARGQPSGPSVEARGQPSGPADGAASVFDARVLAAIGELRGWLAARPEVDPERLVTLLDLPDLRAAELMPEALRTHPERGPSLLAHRSYRGLLIAADARATLVVAELATTASDERAALIEALAARLESLQPALPEGSALHLVGVPLVQATYAQVALRDIVLLVPLTILVIALFLGLAFRRSYAVIGPLAGVGLATIWTLGLIQALGLPFDMVNSVSGAVILVVGVAEGAHIVARHREEVLRLGPAAPPREAIIATMERMTPACLVTSATTAVGFGSLATAQLPAIVSFGLVLAAGVMLAWAIQMVLMPIVLSFTRPHTWPPYAEKMGNGAFERWLERVADRVLAAPMRVALIGLAVLALAGFGALRLQADARAAGELAADHPVARGLAALEERLSGVLVHAVAIAGKAGGTCASDADCVAAGPRSAPLCKRVDRAYRSVGQLRAALQDLAGVRDERLLGELEAALADEAALDGVCTEAVTTPEVVAFLVDLEAWIAADGDARRARGEPVLIARTAGIGDLLADLEDGAGGEAASRAAIAERVAMLEAGAPELVARYLTPDHTRTQLVLRANDIGLAAWRAFEPRLRQAIAQLAARHGIDERSDIVVSGGSTLAEKAISGIAEDLVDSVAFDFLLILVFIVGLVRSVRLALLAMLPNLWPLVVTLGAMGFMGIPIRASTIIVFSVALGIAVDDTIHFVHRYREEAERAGEGALALRRTLLATGRPIVLTSVILVAGFLLNALSDFKAIVEFGVLSAVTLALALLSELFLTPALLYLFRGRLGL